MGLEIQPPGGAAFCPNGDNSIDHVMEINPDAAPVVENSASAVEQSPRVPAPAPAANPEMPHSFYRCATISYVAQLALALGATLSPSFHAEFSYATVALAVVNSFVWCCHLSNPAPGRHFHNGLQNTAQFIGLGTSIAMSAVKTSSSAFEILSGLTSGLFGGHLAISTHLFGIGEQ